LPQWGNSHRISIREATRWFNSPAVYANLTAANYSVDVTFRNTFQVFKKIIIKALAGLGCRHKAF
jgi:hypothetical protein